MSRIAPRRRSTSGNGRYRSSMLPPSPFDDDGASRQRNDGARRFVGLYVQHCDNHLAGGWVRRNTLDEPFGFPLVYYDVAARDAEFPVAHNGRYALVREGRPLGG